MAEPTDKSIEGVIKWAIQNPGSGDSPNNGINADLFHGKTLSDFATRDITTSGGYITAWGNTIPIFGGWRIYYIPSGQTAYTYIEGVGILDPNNIASGTAVYLAKTDATAFRVMNNSSGTFSFLNSSFVSDINAEAIQMSTGYNIFYCD